MWACTDLHTSPGVGVTGHGQNSDGYFLGSVFSLKCAMVEGMLLERLLIFSFIADLGHIRAFLLLTR